MPRKIRELIFDLERAGWVAVDGGKGSRRKFAHARSKRKVILKIDYLKFVRWSEQDKVYVGYCRDLFIGGVCHGKDENKVYAQLNALVDEDIAQRRRAKQTLPPHETIVAMPVAA
jgi:hypothetical protein